MSTQQKGLLYSTVHMLELRISPTFLVMWVCVCEIIIVNNLTGGEELGRGGLRPAGDGHSPRYLPNLK